MGHGYFDSQVEESNRRIKRRDNIYNQLKDKKLSEFTIEELPLILSLLRYYTHPRLDGIYDSELDEIEENLIK